MKPPSLFDLIREHERAKKPKPPRRRRRRPPPTDTRRGWLVAWEHERERAEAERGAA